MVDDLIPTGGVHVAEVRLNSLKAQSSTVPCVWKTVEAPKAPAQNVMMLNVLPCCKRPPS
jgi:hypothetical protein